MEHKGFCLFLSGVSAVGKTTTMNALMDLSELYHHVIVDTTRDLRPGEKDKRSLSKEQFLQNKDAGFYWGTNFTHGNYYGSPKKEVYDIINNRGIMLSDLDIEDAAGVKKIFPDARFIYLVPESLAEIKERLQNERGGDNGRLNKAIQELQRFGKGEFEQVIDKKFVSPAGLQQQTAQQIHSYVLSQLKLKSKLNIQNNKAESNIQNNFDNLK